MTGLDGTWDPPGVSMEMRSYGARGGETEDDFWPSRGREGQRSSASSDDPLSELAKYVGSEVTRVVSETDLSSLLGDERTSTSSATYVPSRASRLARPRRQRSQSLPSEDEREPEPMEEYAGPPVDAKAMIQACKLPSTGFAPPPSETKKRRPPSVKQAQGAFSFDDVSRLIHSAVDDTETDYTHGTMIDACRLPRESRAFAAPLAKEPSKFVPPPLGDDGDDVDERPVVPPVSDDIMIDACTLPSHAKSATPDPYAWDDDRDRGRAAVGQDAFDEDDMDYPESSAPASPAAPDRDPVSDKDLISACTLPAFATSSTPDPYASDFADAPPPDRAAVVRDPIADAETDAKLRAALAPRANDDDDSEAFWL